MLSDQEFCGFHLGGSLLHVVTSGFCRARCCDAELFKKYTENFILSRSSKYYSYSSSSGLTGHPVDFSLVGMIV